MSSIGALQQRYEYHEEKAEGKPEVQALPTCDCHLWEIFASSERTRRPSTLIEVSFGCSAQDEQLYLSYLGSFSQGKSDSREKSETRALLPAGTPCVRAMHLQVLSFEFFQVFGLCPQSCPDLSVAS